MAPPIPPKNPSRPKPISPLRPKKPSIKRVRKTATASTSSLVPEALRLKKKSNDALSVVEDYEDMSRVEASMQLFSAKIEGDLAAVHSEIKTRVESGENAAQADDGTQKLKEKLPTPPSSPDTPTAPTGQPHRNSAEIKASEERRAKIHQDLLRNETFGGLLRRDAYFYGVMNDLKGLREWWDQTRIEWRSRREEMADMEKTLTVLATQKRRTEAQMKEKYMTGHKKAAKTAELARLDKQYYRQAIQINEFSLWFVKTSELLDGVKLRFRQLEIESKDAEIDSRPQNVIEDGFEYILDGINFHHPQLPPWWRNNSPLWWFDQAIADLAQNTQDIKENREFAKAIKRECEKLLLQTHRNEDGIAIVRADKVKAMQDQMLAKELEMQKKYGNNPTRRASLDEDRRLLYAQKRLLDITEKSNVWAKEGIIEALEEEREVKDIDVKSLRIRYSRIRTILRLARESRTVVSRMFEQSREAEVTAPPFVAGLSIIHDICCVEDTRNKFYKQLRNMIQSSELPVLNKKNLSALQESHFGRFQEVHTSLLGFLEQNVDKEHIFHKMDDLYRFLKSAGLEKSELQQIVLEVDEILKARRLLPAKAVVPTLVPSSTPAAPSSTLKMRISWNKIKSVDDARRVLSEQDNRGVNLVPGNTTLGSCLIDFFTSPDIAPNFEHMSKLARSEFFDFVDTFVDDAYSFTPREIEAFLVFCDYNDDLFKLDGDYVSPSDNGWELIDETPIGGPPRKMALAEPPFVEGFARWMVQNQDFLLGRLKLQDMNRDTQEDALLYVTKKYNPYNLNDEDLKTIFAYYGQLGVYFRYLPFVTDEGQPILRRIDNGWNIDTRSKLRPLFSRPKDFFIPLRRVITTNPVKSILEEAKKHDRKFTEAELYLYLQNGIEGGLKYGGLWGTGQTEVTRHKFHLFLRWCDQFKDLFELKRGGNVNIIDSGWDQKY